MESRRVWMGVVVPRSDRRVLWDYTPRRCMVVQPRFKMLGLRDVASEVCFKKEHFVVVTKKICCPSCLCSSGAFFISLLTYEPSFSCLCCLFIFTGVEGKYCLHFHKLHDCPTCVFSNNAIEGSHQRGIIVHQTHSSTVENNVLYNVRGSGIYIEGE